MAQLVKRPFAGVICQQLMNFESRANAYAHRYPQLEGARCVFAQTCPAPTGLHRQFVLQPAARAPRAVAGNMSLQCHNYYSTIADTHRFGDVAFRFPDGVVLGVITMSIGRHAMLAPPVEYIVRRGGGCLRGALAWSSPR